MTLPSRKPKPQLPPSSVSDFSPTMHAAGDKILTLILKLVANKLKEKGSSKLKLAKEALL